MLELVIVAVRAFSLALRGHRELVLENLALRQQLAAFHRTTRCRLRARDRLFWMALARGWRNWRTALIVVQPDTVIRWHRDWLRRRWTRRSQRRPDGRPPIHQQIRTLVREMATANPLWGAPRIHGELRTLGVDVSERTVSCGGTCLPGLDRSAGQALKRGSPSCVITRVRYSRVISSWR